MQPLAAAALEATQIDGHRHGQEADEAQGADHGAAEDALVEVQGRIIPVDTSRRHVCGGQGV